MARHVVASAAEIPPGSRKIVTIRGREIERRVLVQDINILPGDEE